MIVYVDVASMGDHKYHLIKSSDQDVRVIYKKYIIYERCLNSPLMTMCVV